MKLAFAFLSGLVFGLGLLVAGMANPAKVLGFLDLFGRWDPSLAFVMLGAIAACTLAFGLSRKRTQSLLNEPLRAPGARAIDKRLVLGSTVFGIGWGLAGICPGPAIVLVGAGAAKSAVFFMAMVAGMGVFIWFESVMHKQQSVHD